MPTTTPAPYEIAYPVASDSVAPLHTAFSTLADSVYDNFIEHVSPLIAGLQANVYKTTTVSEVSAIVSPPAGSICFTTADKSQRLFDGTAWKLVYQPWTTYDMSGMTEWSGTGSTFKYMVSDNVVYVQAVLVYTAGTFASLVVPLPISSATPVSTNMPIGKGIFRDGTGTFNYYDLSVVHNSSSNAKVMYVATSPSRLLDMKTAGSTSPAPFSVDDQVILNFSYSLA